jgi:hypothetical protein
MALRIIDIKQVTDAGLKLFGKKAEELPNREKVRAPPMT